MAYVASEKVGLFLRIPYSDRRMTSSGEDGTEHESAGGHADPEFSAQVRLLGFSEQPALYNAANFALAAFNDPSYGDRANSTTTTTRVEPTTMRRRPSPLARAARM